MSATATATAPAMSAKTLKHTRLPSGKKIHFRNTQTLVWTGITAVIFAGFIAGLYFGILQANWHVFCLKPWWDHLFTQSWWPTYRHSAFRDIPEPSFAVMGVMTVMAKPKHWNKHVSTLRLVTAPFALITMTFAFGIAGTWLLNYAFGHPILAWHSAGDLMLGFIIGRILHVFWAPVGATIQGHLLASRADKSAFRNRVPLWVKLPLSAPTIRQRFSVMFTKRRQDFSVQVNRAMISTVSGGARAWIISAGAVIFVLVTILGLIGHYGFGAGYDPIPFIQPPVVH